MIISVYAPLDCGESLFFRSDQAVLEGSALNSTKAKRLDTCIHECIKRSDECKVRTYNPFTIEFIVVQCKAQHFVFSRPCIFLKSKNVSLT